MKSAVVTVAALALVVAGCSSSAPDAVASLAGTTSTAASATGQPSDGSDESGTTDEAALLEFAACMRDNGVEDFEDPTVDSEGRPQFGFGQGGDSESVDREVLTAARNACQEHLDGLAFGPGSSDRSEIEDQLYEFAACMRENGYDMPDPDFSGSAGERGGGGPFGAGIDPEDLAFVSALEACEEAFGGTLRFGRGGSGGGGP